MPIEDQLENMLDYEPDEPESDKDDDDIVLIEEVKINEKEAKKDKKSSSTASKDKKEPEKKEAEKKEPAKKEETREKSGICLGSFDNFTFLLD